MPYYKKRYSSRASSRSGRKYSSGSSTYGRKRQRTYSRTGYKRTYGKSGYRRRAPSAMTIRRGQRSSLPMGTYHTTRAMNRVRGVGEPKNKDTSLQSSAWYTEPSGTPGYTAGWTGIAALNPTGQVHSQGLLLNAIQQGYLDSQRIGKDITGTRLYIKLQVNMWGSAITAGNLSAMVRLLIVLDKQANGYPSTAPDPGTPPITSVLVDGDSTSTGFLVPANMNRFVILADKRKQIEATTTSSWDGNNVGGQVATGGTTFEIYKKINYTSVYADGAIKPTTNALLAYLIIQNTFPGTLMAAGTTMNISTVGSAREVYTDS